MSNYHSTLKCHYIIMSKNNQRVYLCIYYERFIIVNKRYYFEMMNNMIANKLIAFELDFEVLG